MQSIIDFIRCCGLLLFVLPVVSGTLISQTKDTSMVDSYRRASFTIPVSDTTIYLPDQFVIESSQAVLLDSILLENGRDYLFNARSGSVTIKKETFTRLHLQSQNFHSIFVRYRSLPFSFKPVYRHREPVTLVDTVTGKKTTVVKPASDFSVDDLFGSNLQKSGSIVRGFTIGSNRDLSLNSGFRLQMSGKLSDDVDVVAALTDENSPIQPEGTTQTLQEIDKVFIQLRSSNLSATLGDFYFTSSGSEFGNINRKLQGGKGEALYQIGKINNNLELVGAVTRGKFTTNQFQGLDGVQGPYRLTGKNNERTIIIIAGTEKVYVNGEPMTRGETADYVIDYANGEVTFSAKRLITAASRITIDFEYSDRQYSRSLLAGKSSSQFLDNKLSFNATVYRESDDENSLIDYSLSDQDKDTLQSAGDDRLRAVRSGVEFTGTGRGQYAAIDTIISLSSGFDTVRIYRYMPEDTIRAVYSITFSYVGSGNGDYNKIALGNYRFAGIRQGSYAPVRFLPLPESHLLTDFDLKAHVSKEFSISGEYALSQFDANKFSPINDDDNTGSAINMGLNYSPQDVRIGGKNIGSFDLNLKERYVNKRFTPIDRVSEIEFNRKWNIADSLKADEEIREGSLTYRPMNSLSVGGGVGWIKRGDDFSTNRYTLSTDYADSSKQIKYDLEYIRSNDVLANRAGRWMRHRANAGYNIGVVSPSIHYEGETFWNSEVTTSKLQQGSFRFNEITPGIQITNVARMSLNIEYGIRYDDSLLAGRLERSSHTFTQRYGWQLQEWNDLSSTLDLTIRKRIFTTPFRLRSNNDIETILLRSQSRYNPLNRGIESDWFYEVATERSAKLERVFQRVPKGTGNYSYAGDINHNNIADDQDFLPTRFDGDYVVILIPTDELTPVIDLKTSSRIRFNGSILFTALSGVEKILSKFSSETYIRVEEKSSESDTKQIYLLQFSHFLNDQTTLTGSNLISQDLYFQENSQEFSARLRFLQRRGLTKYALVSERAYNREQSLQLRWQLLKEISNQIDVVHKNDNVLTSQFSNRSRVITSNNISSDWSYRPEQNIELGFKFGLGEGNNADTTSFSLNDQSVRLVYSLQERGQIRGELVREEVNIERGGFYVPFELTNGRIAGKTWLWRFALDYKVTRFIQATVNYDGRSEGGGSPVHTARAEVRAFF